MSESSSNSPRHEYFLTPIACRHRDESRRMILRAAGMVPPKRAIVLGGGACEEIPLAELIEQFDEITLNDMDAAVVQRAVDALPAHPTVRAKLNLKIADLSGATAPALALIEQALVAAADSTVAIDAMARARDDVQPEPFPMTGRYDLIVCSCVLSQLHFSLTHEAAARYAAKFPGMDETLRESDVWTKALDRAARRMEDRFISNLATLVTDSGLVYLSESAQVCFLQLSPDGRWRTPGTYRMLRTKDLADYLGGQFQIIGRARWEWVVSAPQTKADTGRLFDVQALVLRRAAEPSARVRP